MQVNYLEQKPDFVPCTPVEGDEVLGGYPFRWNITVASKWIEEHLDEIELSVVQVEQPYEGCESKNLDQEFIPRADLTKPILIVRMRPEFFRLIDGNHRVAKARRMGVTELPAYYLTEHQHRQFFTHMEADELYVKYWNEKLNYVIHIPERWGVVGKYTV